MIEQGLKDELIDGVDTSDGSNYIADFPCRQFHPIHTDTLSFPDKSYLRSMIDINCDMGESYGPRKIGQDEAIMPYITSCNIACGFHGGDPETIHQTIRMALAKEKKIGAHPSYQDLEGFGRRSQTITDAKLYAILLYQISALKRMVESQGGFLHHVKLHGALYHDVAFSDHWSTLTCQVVKTINPYLILFVPPSSKLEKIARSAGLKVWREAFADRRYDDYGYLVSRTIPGSVLTDPEEAAQQAVDLTYHHRVTTSSGKYLEIHAETLCIHGDTDNALAIAKKINQALTPA